MNWREMRKHYNNPELLESLVGSMKDRGIDPEEMIFVEGKSKIEASLVSDACFDKENKQFRCPPDIKQWRDENCPNSYCIITGSTPLIAFENREDAAWFKLVWG